MGVFYQSGLVATFYRLGKPMLSWLEDGLASFAELESGRFSRPALLLRVEGGGRSGQ